MELPLNIRNDIAYRKLIRMAQNTFIHTSSTKLWTTHINGFNPLDKDFNALKNQLTKLMISKHSVMPMINDIHIQTKGTIFEDQVPTDLFLERVKGLIDGN